MDMTERRTSWKDLRGRSRASDPQAYDEGYEEATLADSIAQLIYDARTAAGITQSDLAERMGTSQSAIARLEGGGGLPSLATLQKLARTLGLRLRVELTPRSEVVDVKAMQAEIQRVSEAVGAAVQSSLEQFAEALEGAGGVGRLQVHEHNEGDASRHTRG